MKTITNTQYYMYRFNKLVQAAMFMVIMLLAAVLIFGGYAVKEADSVRKNIIMTLMTDKEISDIGALMELAEDLKNENKILHAQLVDAQNALLRENMRYQALSQKHKAALIPESSVKEVAVNRYQSVKSKVRGWFANQDEK